MHHRLSVGSISLALAMFGFACTGEVEPRDEPLGDAQEELGAEDPWPAPGGLPPGGHDPGGPGYGWGAGVNPYPYGRPPDRDPHPEQRAAQQREYDRIHEENQRHRNRPRNDGPHLYGEGFRFPAPPAPQWLFGPFKSEKQICVQACYAKNLDDDAYCRRLPFELREACWKKSIMDLAACIRKCSREYPYET